MKSSMRNPQIKNKIGKACALVAAVFTLPALSFAGTDHGSGNDGENNGNQYGRDKDKGDPSVASAPEFNSAIVLIPVVGAVLVFSSLQMLRRRKKASV